MSGVPRDVASRNSEAISVPEPGWAACTDCASASALSMVDMPVCVLAVAALEKSIKFFGKAVAVEQLLAELNDG